MKAQLYALCIMLLVAGMAACTPEEAGDSDALVVPTTANIPQATVAAIQPSSSSTLPAPPTMTILELADPTAAATPTTVAEDPVYKVIYVEQGDVLNVRSGPSVENDIVGSLLPEEAGISITGRGQLSSGSTWVPVKSDLTAGWVNGRFLTEFLGEESFCGNSDVERVLDSFRAALESGDGDLLAQAVHPERGVRLRLNWWNPELLFRGDQLPELFASSQEYQWGIEDGSGEPIEGSFSAIVYPMLQEDLLGSTETACKEILQGGSAGLVQLPQSYPSDTYYSFHRPGTEEFSGLNWGTWVVGMERWQKAFYISFLVHFDWEI